MSGGPRDTSPRAERRRAEAAAALADAPTQAAAEQWGLYRNCYCTAGIELQKAQDYEAALPHLLWVCYLDMEDPDGFNDLPPGVVRSVQACIDALQLPPDTLEALMVETVEIRRLPHLRRPCARTWRALRAGLREPEPEEDDEC